MLLVELEQEVQIIIDILIKFSNKIMYIQLSYFAEY